MKDVLNKWQIHYSFGRDLNRMERGWRHVQFGIFRVHQWPDPGSVLDKRHYKGFLFSFRIFLPIEF